MPELPEVETTRRGLSRALKGKRIAQVEVRRRDLRFPLPDELEQRLEGRAITAIRRRAKYLLFDLDSREVLLAHLGMSGSFRVMAQEKYEAKKHDHVLLHMEDGRICAFHDPRRFGLMDMIAQGVEKGHPLLARLGPEPLSKYFTPEYLEAKLSRRSGPIKPTLMDQQLVVGVGNIYASESLFLVGIHPETPANKVACKSPAIIAAIRQVLKDAINAGGSTLRDYVGADGSDGYFQHRFLVYERAGKPCTRCGEIIRMQIMTGRSTYWCPHCQPKPAKRRNA